MLSHQDWFLAAALHEINTAIQNTSLPADVVSHLQNALEFIYSSSTANYDVRDHTLHLLYNTTLRRRDAYLADTFHRLQPMVKRQLRSHSLRDPLLFSEEDCQLALRQYNNASSANLLTQATRCRQDDRGHHESSRPATKRDPPHTASSHRSSSQRSPPLNKGKRPSSLSKKRGGGNSTKGKP